VAKTIKVTYRVNDDGSLERISKKAEKAARSTDNLTQSRNRYNKVEKGAAQLTSNSTKAFAKQAGAIGSGLVPAYATLAANIFALTALFGALQRAAQVEQLTQGIAQMGRATGYAMGTLSRDMQAVTNGALSLEEAMRSTALITSAGFDSSTVKEIGSVAQNAAQALGRNTQESIERFTRGLAKMEPELLDELGLFVRVDEAAEEYARKLGKSASQLTNFEKRQAFANATLEQAREKFGQIELDANPYEKLAASFADLSKAGLNLLNKVLEPIVSFVAESTLALTGALALFASTISTQLIGGLSSYAEKAREAAIEQRGLTTESSRGLRSSNRNSRTLDNLSQSLRDGSAANREYQEAIQGQVMSQRSNIAQLNRGSIDQAEYTRRVRVARGAIEEINATQMRQRLATAATAESNAIAALQSGRYSVALRNLRRSMIFYRAALTNAAAAQGFFNRTLQIGTVIGRAATTVFRLLGAVFSKLLGPISLLILGIELLAGAFSWVRNKFISEETKKLEEILKDLGETSKELGANFSEVDSALNGTSRIIKTTTDALIAYGNTLDTVIDKAKEMGETGSAKAIKAQANFLNASIQQSDRLRDSFQSTFGTTVVEASQEGVAAALAHIEEQDILAKKVDSVKNSFKEAETAATEFFNSLKPKSTVSDLKNTVTGILNSLEGAQFKEIGKVIAEEYEKNAGVDRIVDSIANVLTVGMNNIMIPPEIISKSLSEIEKEIEKNKKKLEQPDITPIMSDEILNQIERLTGEYEKLEPLSKRLTLTEEQKLRVAKEFLKEQESLEVVGKARIATLTTELKTEREKGEITIESAKEQIRLHNEIRDEQINQTDQQLTLLSVYRAAETVTENIVYLDLQITELTKQRLLLQEERINGLEQEVQLAKTELAIAQEQNKVDQAAFAIFQKQINSQNEIISARRKLMEMEKKQANRANPAIDSSTLTLSDEYEITKKMERERLLAAVEEHKLKIQMINLEYDLLGFQMQVLRLEAELLNKKSGTDLINLTNLDAAIGRLGTARKDALEAAGYSFITKYLGIVDEGNETDHALKTAIKDQQKLLDLQESSNKRSQLNTAGLKEAALLNLQDEQKKKRLDLENKRDSSTDDLTRGKHALELAQLVNEEEKTRIDLINERVQTAARLGGSAMGSVTAVTAYGEINQETYKSASGSDKIKMLGESLAPMISELEKLGPEGALVSAVVQGSFIMGEAFTAFSEKLAANTATTADGLALAAAGVATLANIASAASNAKVAGIDKEIAAEKKRDGVSAASVARIAALEKKKEATKRKAFEQNKKLQMASVILSTASAAMAAWSPPPGGLGPLFGGALSAGIVALGAAQLAIIAGTSYEGGGSLGTQGPSKISVGNRQNSVDLAKARSPSGELAYARGAQGTGTGMTNYTPAFTGAKYRAGGGNVGLMVGEQGPEMFIPDRPGTIVPADETQGLGGQPVNVNFSIQAIDSSSVEELLMVQRGNIIGMIREAANSHGELFLENINNQSLPVDRYSRRY
jgi:hypothetical protein